MQKPQCPLGFGSKYIEALHEMQGIFRIPTLKDRLPQIGSNGVLTFFCPSFASWWRSNPGLQQPFHVFPENIELDIGLVADLHVAEDSHIHRMGDDGDSEFLPLKPGNC